MWAETPAYGATAIAHEGFHLADARYRVAHSGLYNAFRLQGLVSQLTGLPYNREWVTMTAPEAAACARLG
ncbi:Hypothetical protein I5071_57350 [Sandaracinus amylolyticus]|nr:Hypothetical protein I5071_57350 [Sandaracinus amylolyticus]